MISKLHFVALAVLSTACASAPKAESPPKVEPGPVPIAIQPATLQIDVDGLQRSLGLERSRFTLGYQEKTFNTCDAGFGYPKVACRLQTMMVLNFRLQCRDTTGTTSEIVTNAQTQPIANKTVRWQVGKQGSTTPTDDDGYAQIRGIYSKSPRSERIKLAVGTHFVYMRAGELTRIVTPPDWCR